MKQREGSKQKLGILYFGVVLVGNIVRVDE